MHSPASLQKEIFNREKETKCLTNLLVNKEPQLSLITGPVNSGKSILMNHILDTLPERKPSPKTLSLNMRTLPFLNVDSFIECMNTKLPKWYQEMINAFSIQTDFLKSNWNRSSPNLCDLLKSMS